MLILGLLMSSFSVIQKKFTSNYLRGELKFALKLQNSHKINRRFIVSIVKWIDSVTNLHMCYLILLPIVFLHLIFFQLESRLNVLIIVTLQSVQTQLNQCIYPASWFKHSLMETTCNHIILELLVIVTQHQLHLPMQDSKATIMLDQKQNSTDSLYT